MTDDNGVSLEVLDASALLAWLQNESGADRVTLKTAIINSVNWSETLQKAQQHGVDVEGLREGLESIGLKVLSFDVEEAEVAASLYPATRQAGLSLGDRACLATAKVKDAFVVTAERSWKDLDTGVSVRQIR